MKSPNLDKKTNHNKQHHKKQCYLNWQIQKLHKEKISKPTPNPTGINRSWPKSEDFKSFTPKQLMLFTMTPLKEKRHPAYTN
ncbi:hypothetical protein, partial [Corynebacterium guaraldiae]|uniref:hypothetical protein n=1 Tax=Corynebacterium guaraldiae TaxID=3051103 RepID=UPI001E64BEA7